MTVLFLCQSLTLLTISLSRVFAPVQTSKMLDESSISTVLKDRLTCPFIETFILNVQSIFINDDRDLNSDSRIRNNASKCINHLWPTCEILRKQHYQFQDSLDKAHAGLPLSLLQRDYLGEKLDKKLNGCDETTWKLWSLVILCQ